MTDEPIRSGVARLRRATDSEQKQRKRAAIIAAARELYSRASGELPSAAAIAERAGLAKGTVYLYFKSKEDIFLALVGDEFGAFLCELADGLRRLEAPGAAPTAGALIEHFVDAYVQWLRRRPLLLDLASISHGASARGASIDELRAMKGSLARNLGSLAESIGRLSGAPQPVANDLLISTYALSVGLHQTLDYSAQEQAVLENAQFSALRPEFWPLLGTALRQLWTGALLGRA